MTRERVLPSIDVPAVPVYSPQTLEDHNLVARVVVEPTGLFGLGRPIYLEDYDENSKIDPGLKIKVISKPTIMWCRNGEGPADGFIHGCFVWEARVNRVVPPQPSDPVELDS